MDDIFIPANTIKQLREHSLESKIQAAQALVESHAEQIFGSICETSSVVTFDDYVVAANEEGTFKKVFFESKEEGLTITKVEDFTPAVYKGGAVRNFVVESAENAVNSILGEDIEGAKEALRELCGLTEEVKDVMGDYAAAAIVDMTKMPKLWRRILENYKKDIADLIGESKETPAKYTSLYESRTREGAPEVLKDLKELQESISDQVKLLMNFASKLREADITDKVVGSAKALSEDLYNDAKETASKLEGSLKNLRNAGALAIVYDTLSEELEQYKVATKFLEAISDRLNKATNA